MDGPDVISAFATFLMRCLADNGKSTELVGRSLDLASAYRQLAIADDSLCHAYLSVYDPTKESAALFQQVALPFGSRTAVNAFIRCARFLQLGGGSLLQTASIMLLRRLRLLLISSACEEHTVNIVPYAGYLGMGL